MAREIFFSAALREAIDEEMAADPSIFLIGEEIGIWGGIFRVTAGLLDKYGPDRVIDTPISEILIGGAAVGAAMTGSRPIAEFMFNDFMCLAMEQIVNQAAKARYMFGGKVELPIVYRANFGSGTGQSAQHTQSLEAWFTHVPGLKVVAPSTPSDAKGLLKSAIRDNNVVIFLEHKMLSATKGDVSEEEYLVPLGRADIKRPGTQATIVTYAREVHFALAAAERLAQEGIDVEVVDLRTLYPLDIDTVVTSVRKTNHAMVVHEAVRFGGFGAEIASQIQELAFDYLDAPVKRMGATHSPVPFSEPLEAASIPQPGNIAEEVRQLIGNRLRPVSWMTVATTST